MGRRPGPRTSVLQRSQFAILETAGKWHLAVHPRLVVQGFPRPPHVCATWCATWRHMAPHGAGSVQGHPSPNPKHPGIMNCLVVDLPLLKNMSSSVGMMTFPTEWKVIKAMFQTTNQWKIKDHCVHIHHHGTTARHKAQSTTKVIHPGRRKNMCPERCGKHIIYGNMPKLNNQNTEISEAPFLGTLTIFRSSTITSPKSGKQHEKTTSYLLQRCSLCARMFTSYMILNDIPSYASPPTRTLKINQSQCWKVVRSLVDSGGFNRKTDNWGSSSAKILELSYSNYI